VERTFPPDPAYQDRSPHTHHVRIALTTSLRTLQPMSRPPSTPMPLVARSICPHPTTQYRAAANSRVEYHAFNTAPPLAYFCVRSGVFAPYALLLCRILLYARFFFIHNIGVVLARFTSQSAKPHSLSAKDAARRSKKDQARPPP